MASSVLTGQYDGFTVLSHAAKIRFAIFVLIAHAGCVVRAWTPWKRIVKASILQRISTLAKVPQAWIKDPHIAIWPAQLSLLIKFRSCDSNTGTQDADKHKRVGQADHCDNLCNEWLEWKRSTSEWWDLQIHVQKRAPQCLINSHFTRLTHARWDESRLLRLGNNTKISKHLSWLGSSSS
jgi:hypothetical protein